MKTSIRADTKLWVFEETDQPITVGVGSVAKGERVYVFGYTWFEARTGALAALQRSSGLVHGREIENVEEHIVEEGSMIAFVDRGSSWFEIVETCRQMSGEEARTLLAFPSPFPAEPGSEKTRGEEGILSLGHVGHAAEPTVPAEQPAVEPEPASSRVYPSSEALRALLNGNADYNADWPEIAHIASQAIEALEALEAKISQRDSASFEDAWNKKVSEGYQYGSDALEQVRFGWDIRNDTLAGFDNREAPCLQSIVTPSGEREKFRCMRPAGHDGAHETNALNTPIGLDETAVLHARTEEGAEIFRLREEVKALELARFRAARQSEDYRVLGAKQEKELTRATRETVRLEAAVYEMERSEELLKAQKEVAYDERNRLVAVFASMALALGWNAGIGLHEDPASGGTSPQEEWDPEWRTLVMVETPEGQASWHFHDSQKHLVAHLPSYVAKWDGHDAPTKYMRLERLGCIRFEPAKLGWEAAAKECVTWSKRRAKEAEQISRASGNHTSSDLWTRLRAEAEGFAELGARFRGFAQLEQNPLQFPQGAAEYERGKGEADELHLRMLELRDAEAYRRGLRAAAEECRAFSSRMNERGKAKAFADAVVGTAQWDQKGRYEAGRDAARECKIRIEALVRVST